MDSIRDRELFVCPTEVGGDFVHPVDDVVHMSASTPNQGHKNLELFFSLLQIVAILGERLMLHRVFRGLAQSLRWIGLRHYADRNPSTRIAGDYDPLSNLFC
jgi:hypothetical protein